MLLKEKITVYCKNHTKHTNMFCEKNAEFFNAKASDIYSNHCALKGYIKTKAMKVSYQRQLQHAIQSSVT
jgi:hypothetical protein